ncbi:MAG: alanine--tRNA ligase [Candidatus Omnitrophota bacterium]
MKTDILRKKFINFFKSKKHKVIASASLIPYDDQTVLFTSAGMSQFKNEFMGKISGFSRATTAQKCLRTDDLDKVGKTPSHHTFFEMLGNFSFGDYFKKEAISWAWEFLTQELKINPNNIWVSVYLEDDEAYKIWHSVIKIPEEKIVKLGASDNFWPQDAIKNGPNGPCGPCSEIFFDWGESFGCGKGCKPGCNCGKSSKRFVEVWNLVFTQFNRRDGGILEPLPNKNIDTGMGLERIASVMQGKFTNFEIDIFEPLIKELERQSKIKYIDKRESFNIIADHLRAIVFAVSDGVIPSSEDRGYVIRKLIRKAILEAKKIKIDKPFLYKIVPTIGLVMKGAYPEIDKRKEDISQLLQHEEKSFYHTLKTAARLLEESFLGVTRQQGTGLIAFNLYDTYGIPVEITKDWLKNKNIILDEAEFKIYLDEQKERSKKKAKFSGDIFGNKKIISIKPTIFLGYNYEALSSSKLLGILKGDKLINEVNIGEEVSLILDKTCFYPESGGQLGDQGKIYNKNCEFKVLDTKKIADIILHIGKLEKGSLKRSTSVNLEIDVVLRSSRRRAHTATHILQFALRKVLGQHVRQAGSFVDSDYLRFDFTHFKALTEEETKRVEEIVNDKIMNNDKVATKNLSLKQAQKQGALAFFEEKYGEKVRVVSISNFSKELCGGTHLDSTGSIGSFRIISEGSSAKGIRRIEAVTGRKSFEMQDRRERELLQVINDLNIKIKNIEQNKNSIHLKFYEKEVGSYVDKAVLVNSSRIIKENFEDLDINMLRRLVDLTRMKVSSGAVIFSSKKMDGLFLVIAITKDLVDKGISAVSLIKEVSSLINGSGGGRDDFAQAGGKEIKNLNAALDSIQKSIEKKLSKQ